jgi:glutamate racemase
MSALPQPSCPIGILDSGVGGLSILRALRHHMPRENFVYFGDSLNAPYGARNEAEILHLIQQAADTLLKRQIKLLVLGSSTITTVALDDLGARHSIPIVGTYPAVDLAVEATRSKVVGVLSTRATAQGQLLDHLIARFAVPANVRVLKTWHNDLVPMIERGETDTPPLRAVLREVLEPLALAGADQLVLASTHFTFLQPVIRSEFGSAFGFVDSASTVAGEVSTVLDRHGLGIPAGAPGSTAYLFTGDPELARAAAAALLNSIASQDGTVTEELDIRSALERQAL